MKKQFVKTFGGAALAIAVLTVITQVWVSGQVQRGEQGLNGSWDERVTARDCATGDPIPGVPVFPAMLTYDQGGTMQESDLGGPGSVRLQGHGVWQHQVGRQYSAEFRFLVFLPDRTFVGTNIVRSSITLSQSGNEYTSTDTLELIGPDGNVILTGCATTVATRFQ